MGQTKKGHPFPLNACSFCLLGSDGLYLLFKQFFDVRFNFIRCCFGSIPFQNTSVLIHKEFGEVPFDGFGAEYAWRFFGKVLEKRVSA
ncbi:hypothetical protein SAMN06272722_103518 [Paenibacillus sp. RU5A]|nr:hypothetical protein SAMN06272722_103518 [Paenibacillus sp. RU5A]SOC69478.1 hypothetical protein SAMN05880581_103518 [Paenibacillus sp. RU26A]SOC71923.1 hypothetical protein SAMN05880586_103518 [Paenibacillus sp. RU5M]